MDFRENEVQELENKIPMYAKAYYEGHALISDAEFDRLTDRLRELSPNSPILHTPRLGLRANRCKSKT